MLPVKSSLLPNVSRFFDDDWSPMFNWSNLNYSDTATTLPSVNVRENDDAYLVEMAAPGMKKDDFHVEVKDNMLTIKGEVKNEHGENRDGAYTRREFRYQSFQRSFNLNNDVVDDSNIEATYKDGILGIIIPKREEARRKPARTIKIS